MTIHLIAYPLTLALGYGCYALIHRAAIAKVRSELARIQPILQKALEGQADYDAARERVKRLEADALERKWGGNGVVRSGIIT